MKSKNLNLILNYASTRHVKSKHTYPHDHHVFPHEDRGQRKGGDDVPCLIQSELGSTIVKFLGIHLEYLDKEYLEQRIGSKHAQVFLKRLPFCDLVFLCPCGLSLFTFCNQFTGLSFRRVFCASHTEVVTEDSLNFNSLRNLLVRSIKPTLT